MNNQLINLFDVKNITNNIIFLPNVEYEDIKIIGIYSEDLNILKIHEAVKYKFSCLCDKIQWLQYFDLVKDILIEYISVASNNIKGIINIGSVQKNNEYIEKSDVIFNRLLLIKKYLNITSNYINLDILWKLETDAICKNCNCFYENIEMSCKCFNNLDEFSIFTKNTIKISDNSFQSFKKGLDKYEGNFYIKLPSYLFDDLNAFFLENGFKSNTYYQSLPLNSSGKKDGTNLKILIEGLNKTNNSAFFHVINIIAYNYWGWALPNLSKIREKILDQYKQTQEVYEKIKTRDSNLNINIRIYAHLKSLDFDCNYDDFKMLTTRSAIDYNNEMLKKMFEECGLKYISIV